MNNNNYKFEYIKQEELPESFIKSLNKKKTYERHKPVLSEESKKENLKKSIKKWQQKELICKNCNKTYKNSYRVYSQ